MSNDSEKKDWKQTGITLAKNVGLFAAACLGVAAINGVANKINSKLTTRQEMPAAGSTTRR